MNPTSRFSLLEVSLMLGTNERGFTKIKQRDFKNLLWLSNNMETVAHYYEGVALEFRISLDNSVKMEYIREESELLCPVEKYTWGYAEMRYPIGATWYSFSRNYLNSHLISVTEIFPDLSLWNED